MTIKCLSAQTVKQPVAFWASEENTGGDSTALAASTKAVELSTVMNIHVADTKLTFAKIQKRPVFARLLSIVHFDRKALVAKIVQRLHDALNRCGR